MDKLGWKLIITWILLSMLSILIVTYAVDAPAVPVIKYVEGPRHIDIVEVFTEVEVIREVEVPIEVVKEVEILKEVEVIKEVPLKFKEFESVEALEEWYGRNEPPVVLYADEEGVIDLVNHRFDPRWDCDDYATSLYLSALAQGYLMDRQLVENDEHMLNMVVIGNDIFYLEPDPRGFEIWKVAERD